MASLLIISLTIILITVINSTNAACTWPSDFVDSTWIDSLKGDLVFGTTQMDGWSVNVQIQGDASLQVLDVWECVLYDETGPYLIMKTNQTFLQFVVTHFYGYRCLKLEKITDASYRYYQMDPVQNAINFERLTPNEDGSLTDPSFLCENSQVTPATGSEFQVMIKKGYESVAMVTCPYSLLVDYTFTYVDTSDSTMLCDQNNDVGNIELCSNITMVTLQSPACSSNPLYSDADTTTCVDVVTVGSDTFISLYNHQYDSSNTDSNIYQFACVGINSNGSSMSVTAEHCKANQSPTEIPVTNSNQAVGAVWSLTPTGAPCPPCPDLTAPAQGTVTIVTNGATTSATYTCNGNYTLSGNETQTCQTNGTWSGTKPSCTCPLPSSPTHGDVTVSTDGINATFTCNAGYVLDGNSEHTCDIVSNVWSDTEPSCTECEQLTAPASGSIEIITTGMTSVVYYECDAGTTILGDETRTCQQDTTWTLLAPTCTSCLSLSSISSGNITLTTSGTTTTAIFTCFDGYDLVGDNTSVCTSSGTWDSSSPSCECMSPNEPGNGSLTVSTDKTEVTYTCDLGYSINGPDVRYCQSDGTGWSSVDPSCTLCEGLSSPTNGSATTSTNGTITKVTYSCDVGFTMNGDSISRCESDGSWTTNSPTCSECNNLPTVTLGSYTFQTDGTATYAEYTCDLGTTISGDITVGCDANGEWAASSVNVSCVACLDLSDVIGGSFSIETNGTTSIAEFVCESEYEIQGDTTIECQSDGTWSSVTPECVKIGSSTESQSNTSGLLPAVIAMAIVIVLLVVALVASGIYIWKLKKSGTTDNDKAKTKTKTATNGILPNVQRPPLYHGNSIMDPWKTSSHSSAPVSHNNTPRSDTVTSNTPLSMKSVVSAGSLNFDLVRETTTSSMYNDHPAPWSNKPLKDRDNNVGNSQIGSFPPIDEYKPGALITTKHDNGTSSPRKKKISYGKKMQRQNSSTNGQKSNTTSSLSKTAGTNNGRIPTSGDIVPKQRAVLATRAGDVGGIKSKLELQEKAERASTPVKHYLEVKDLETNDTPRSNTFTTVQ